MKQSLFSDVDHDVIICGGGLAGLCLAKQLRSTVADLNVLVCERTPSPLPASAFKVGESTIEIGAHYFADVIGLRDHLEEAHLEKLGLRYFYLGAGGLASAPEFGLTRFLPAKAYQLARGTLEDELRRVARASGAHIREGVRIRDLDIGVGGAPHTVTIESEHGVREVRSCRWVIDAMGRRRFLQRRLGLTRDPAERHSASWFRLNGKLDINEAIPASHHRWHERVEEPRWNSTNHIMIPGGWIWVIPLGSGHTSVGIVVTEAIHPVNGFDRLESALRFIAGYVPELEAPMRRLEVLDFILLRGYTHGSSAVFSSDRWACVGEAGTFIDPYYSLGSNMIAYANGFTTQMIADDVGNSLDATFVDYANRWLLSLVGNLTHNVHISYPFHHEPVIMALKTIWDYFVGWGFSDPQFYASTYLDIPTSTTISGLGARMIQTQGRLMALFRDWAKRAERRLLFDYIDYYNDLPTLADLFERSLPSRGKRSFAEVLQFVREGLDRIEELAHVIFYLAIEDVLPERLLEIRARGWLHVGAIGLDPERWESDGLFAPRTQPRPERLQQMEMEIRSLFHISGSG